MKAWTDHLMPSIEAFAHVTPNDLPPISIDDYNSIVHLAWVQPFTDHIEQYRESPDIAPTLIRVSTPSVTILRLVGPLFFYFPRALFPY